jgi:hypothetical protein
MPPRPRIDLDGVMLFDERDRSQVIALVRYRTTEGLVLLMPESTDFLVPWEQLRSASLDLRSGQVRIEVAPETTARENWLRGARVLVGTWTDRVNIEAGSAPSGS